RDRVERAALRARRGQGRVEGLRRALGCEPLALERVTAPGERGLDGLLELVRGLAEGAPLGRRHVADPREELADRAALPEDLALHARELRRLARGGDRGESLRAERGPIRAHAGLIGLVTKKPRRARRSSSVPRARRRPAGRRPRAGGSRARRAASG